MPTVRNNRKQAVVAARQFSCPTKYYTDGPARHWNLILLLSRRWSVTTVNYLSQILQHLCDDRLHWFCTTTGWTLSVPPALPMCIRRGDAQWFRENAVSTRKRDYLQRATLPLQTLRQLDCCSKIVLDFLVISGRMIILFHTIITQTVALRRNAVNTTKTAFHLVFDNNSTTVTLQRCRSSDLSIRSKPTSDPCSWEHFF